MKKREREMEQVGQAIDAAVAAGNAAALKVWERDGKTDRGTCGGSMLEFDARTLVAKVAEGRGYAYRSGSEVWLRLELPSAIQSQNADIPQAQYEAFRKSLVAAGYDKAIKRAWDYID